MLDYSSLNRMVAEGAIHGLPLSLVAEYVGLADGEPTNEFVSELAVRQHYVVLVPGGTRPISLVMDMDVERASKYRYKNLFTEAIEIADYERVQEVHSASSEEAVEESLSEGFLSGSPKKLPNGRWGTLIVCMGTTNLPTANDVIGKTVQVTTRSGKSWMMIVEQVVKEFDAKGMRVLLTQNKRPAKLV